MTAGSVLITGLDRPVATVTLDRSDKRNAMNLGMWSGLRHAVEEIARSEARVVVVRGSDARAFCAGADLEELLEVRQDPALADHYESMSMGTTRLLARLPQLTIALVRGACIGAGLEIAAACDVRIASESATLGVTASRMGILYGFSATKRLVDLVGASAAKLMLATSEVMDAAKAADRGLVDEVCPDDSVEDRVAELAAMVATQSRISVQGAKRFVELATRGQVDDSSETVEMCERAFASPEHTEAVRRFLAARNGR